MAAEGMAAEGMIAEEMVDGFNGLGKNGREKLYFRLYPCVN
jgi:hypothetical protein